MILITSLIRNQINSSIHLTNLPLKGGLWRKKRPKNSFHWRKFRSNCRKNGRSTPMCSGDDPRYVDGTHAFLRQLLAKSMLIFTVLSVSLLFSSISYIIFHQSNKKTKKSHKKWGVKNNFNRTGTVFSDFLILKPLKSRIGNQFSFSSRSAKAWKLTRCWRW